MFNGCSIDEEIDEVTQLTFHPEIPPLKDVLQNMKLISMTCSQFHPEILSPLKSVLLNIAYISITLLTSDLLISSLKYLFPLNSP
jgi:hypothetical protein